MPEAIGHGGSPPFQTAQDNSRTEQIAEQMDAMNARQSEAVAETVKRQADFSSNRAEFLSRQAEQLEDRAELRTAEAGLGSQVDLSV